MAIPRRARTRIELLQGTLELLLLQILRWGPQHGYGIAQRLSTQSSGVLQVDTGSPYPAPPRLARQGLVAAEWTISERRQRVRTYRLTPAGRKQLAAERSRWDQLSFAITSVLHGPRSL